MDIGSDKDYPASALSNFTPRSFIFDGVWCASAEGLFQAFKFDNIRIQEEVCKLVGVDAKRRGRKRNKIWMRAQKLWWKGKKYDRSGEEYQRLLDRVFDALSEDVSFCKALLDTGNERLTHFIGEPRKTDTVLTEQEFCSRLENIRIRLQTKKEADNASD